MMTHCFPGPRSSVHLKTTLIFKSKLTPRTKTKTSMLTFLGFSSLLENRAGQCPHPPLQFSGRAIRFAMVRGPLSGVLLPPLPFCTRVSAGNRTGQLRNAVLLLPNENPVSRERPPVRAHCTCGISQVEMTFTFKKTLKYQPAPLMSDLHLKLKNSNNANDLSTSGYCT